MLVKVRNDVSTAQRLKTTVHELAHIRCEHLTGARIGEDLHRGRRETKPKASRTSSARPSASIPHRTAMRM